MTSQASADGDKCILTHIQDNTTINMLMYSKPQHGMVLQFDKAAGWAKDLLQFKVVYSTMIGSTHLFAATAMSTTAGRSPRYELVEIYFDLTKGNRKSGILKAGDQNQTYLSMGKGHEYTITCEQNLEVIL